MTLKYDEILAFLPDLNGKDLNPSDGLVIYAAGQAIRHRDENPELMAAVIEQARQGDGFCFRAMDDVLRFYAAKGMPLTDDLIEYAANRDSLKPRGGKSKNTNFFRNLIILDAADALRREGVSDNSAADIIAIELSKRGYSDAKNEAVRMVIKNGKRTP